MGCPRLARHKGKRMSSIHFRSWASVLERAVAVEVCAAELDNMAWMRVTARDLGGPLPRFGWQAGGYLVPRMQYL